LYFVTGTDSREENFSERARGWDENLPPRVFVGMETGTGTRVTPNEKFLIDIPTSDPD